MKPEHAESLSPLALLAMREAGADGYALYAVGADGHEVCLSMCGASVPPRIEDEPAILRFQLRVAGSDVGQIAFVFRSQPPEPVRVRLEQTAGTLEAIWKLSETPSRLLQLTTRVSRLQGELADLKIADRVRGFLDQPVPNATEIIAEHVAACSQARRLEALLEQKVRDLEAERLDRELVSEAKLLLRNAYGLSEEQAYNRLRSTSRRSRQRLGEVARRFIETARPATA